MTIEEINKWLDNEYGVSYTKLEELHDFYFEKYCDLEEQNKRYKEVIEKVSSQIKLYGKYNGEKCTRGFSVMTADFNKLLDMLKEVE